MKIKLGLASLLLALSANAFGQNATVDPVAVNKKAEFYLQTFVTELMHDPVVVRSINAQNVFNGDLENDAVEALDQQWRQEREQGGGALIDRVLQNSLSEYLLLIKEISEGMVTEIIVMDNKGLNVGVSDITSDYWQGDEAKYQKTFLVGAGVVFVDEIELDDSTQIVQTQASVAIVNPFDDQVIGAVTFGLNAELLLAEIQ
jgi:hypothetical protein